MSIDTPAGRCTHLSHPAICGVCSGDLPDDPRELRANARAMLNLAETLDAAAGRYTAQPARALDPYSDNAEIDAAKDYNGLGLAVPHVMDGFVYLSVTRPSDPSEDEVDATFTFYPEDARRFGRLLLEMADEAQSDSDDDRRTETPPQTD